MFIEKMAAADGIKKMNSSNQFETNMKNMILEKFDILTFFRKKYDYYFQKKNK